MIHASTGALEQVLAGLASLRSGISERQTQASHRLESEIRAIEQQLAGTTDRLEFVQGELEANEDDDDDEGDFDEVYGDLECEAENLRETIQGLDTSIHKSRDLLSRIQALEIRLGKTVEIEIPEAQDFVTRKLEALRGFQNYNLESVVTSKNIDSSTSTVTSVASRPEREAAPTKPPAMISLLSIRLPEKFTWMPLAEAIKKAGLKQEELDFKKASVEEFQQLLKQLHDEVLPELRRTKDLVVVREALENKDRIDKRYAADSRTNIFNLFFGDTSPIVVDKNDGRFTNGRHRVWVAFQLGWTHLPTKKT